MTFRVEDEHGAVVAEGNDLDALRERARPRLREELATRRARARAHGLTAWTIGELPRTSRCRAPARRCAATRRSSTRARRVGVRVLETPGAQAAAMARRHAPAAAARRRRRRCAACRRRLTNAQRLALAGAPHDGVGAVLDDAATAALDALIAEAGGPAWDAGRASRGCASHVAGRLQAKTGEVVAAMARILDAAREVERRLEPLSAAAVRARAARRARPARAARVRPASSRGPAPRGWRTSSATCRAPRGGSSGCPTPPPSTATACARSTSSSRPTGAQLDAWPRGRALPQALREVPWMLEELRVSQFAQGLGTRGQVSAKRIRRALEDAAA